MIWAAFFAGMFMGGLLGLSVMCLCVVSGDESRREEMMERNTAVTICERTLSQQ